MITIWLLADQTGKTILTDNQGQKDQLLADGWTLISVGGRPERSFLDELVEH